MQSVSPDSSVDPIQKINKLSFAISGLESEHGSSAKIRSLFQYYQEIADAYRDSDWMRSKFYVSKSVKIRLLHRDVFSSSEAEEWIEKALLFQKTPEDAASFFEEVAEFSVAERLPDSVAITYYEKAADLYRNDWQLSKASKLFFKLGELHENRKAYLAAADSFVKAMRCINLPSPGYCERAAVNYAKSEPPEHEKAAEYFRLTAKWYENWRQFRFAARYYMRAAKHELEVKRVNSWDKVASSYCKAADCYRADGDSAQMEACYQLFKEKNQK